MKKLVIFDLDGTLLDTVADLAQSVNHALKILGHPLRTPKECTRMVGNGVMKLFERALPEDRRTQEDILAVKEHFVPFYNEHSADLTAPYPGVVHLLELLQAKGVILAVASNKYQAAAQDVVTKYFPNIKFATVLGQREGIPIKPDPTIIYDVLKITGIALEDALFVGDTGVDMETAINAKIDVCAVEWGFRSREELETYNPNWIVNEAKKIIDIVGK